VIAEYGVSVPEGALPVMSVGSAEEAKLLLTLACQTNLRGEFVASELAVEQTLDNLYAFGLRLQRAHDKGIAGTPQCTCEKETQS